MLLEFTGQYLHVDFGRNKIGDTAAAKIARCEEIGSGMF